MRGKMSNIITGAIAVLLSMVFLLFYAIRLHSVPLLIIIMANFACLAFDYYKSIKEGEELI
jgi:hypothetical protein